jgi:hypothetical protein
MEVTGRRNSSGVGEQPQLKKVRTIEVGFEDIAVDLGEADFPVPNC